VEQGLRELAERVGILASYRAVDGRTQRATSDATRRALLRDMGIDVSRPAAVMAALDRAEQQRLLPATGLVRPGEPSRVRLRRSLRHAASG